MAGFAIATPNVRAAQHGMSVRPPGVSMLRADSLAPFVDPLAIPSVARPSSVRHAPVADTPHYRIAMRAVSARVHRSLPPTAFWSFGSTFPGPTIEARRGCGLFVEWINNLPARHFLPIDHTIHGAEAGTPDVRAVVHVHGANVRPEDDGYPDDWYLPGASKSSFYPNDQDAATLWYHDHTMGINRLNVYAGLMGLYIIRDDEEDKLALPSGRFEVPLLLCDRQLRS
ncbi:MAG TPA: multicopper oxidase domain-containing protein, partial [Vicinamibacterales bacterium]|nr:multicopper oxidase domain-containing protein [Vicinamibacterales bacterium]